MAKTLTGDLGALKFELGNARKDLRCCTDLAEGLAIPRLVGEAVHPLLALACALDQGDKSMTWLVEAQEQISGAVLVPR